MGKPSVSIPDGMLDEIERRREKSENRSEYIRDALRARFEAEDAGEWTDSEEETRDNSIKAEADAN